MNKSRMLVLALSAFLVVFAAIQLVPFGRSHVNPPDGTLAAFDGPATEQLAKRACFDCHSNQTKWPWYASVAPISWRLQSHVDEGREKLNFTAFDPSNEEVADAAGEAGETITKGEMPPFDYLLMHPEARLTAAEKQALVAGLDRTFAAFVEGGEKGGAEPGGKGGAEAGEKGEAGDRD